MKKFVLFGLLLSGTLAQAAAYKLDNSHMEIGFSVKHLMISNVKGHFDKFDGGFDYDSSKKTLKDVNVVIETASINTGVKDRDDHLRGPDFFDATKFPKMAFKGESVDMAKDGKSGVVHGTLTIKDKTEKQDLNFTNNGEVDFMGTKKVAFTATGKLDRTKFGLVWNKPIDKVGGMAVGTEIQLSFDGEANMVSAKK